MGRAHTIHVVDPNSSVWRNSGTVLLLVIASMLVACGGGGGAASAAAGGTNGGSTGPNTAALAWDPSTDSVSGYRIYYGTAPGAYVQSLGQGVDVGNVTTYTVTGLSSGTRYYFAATAFDTSNNESTYSNEVFKDIP